MKLQDWSATSKGATETEDFTDWDDPVGDGLSLASSEQKVFSNGEKILLVVPKETIEINGDYQPAADQEIVFFNRRTLVPGNSYTLHLRIRTPIYAASNIYWDNHEAKLTFALADATGSSRNEGYQGVYFKWGSLIGISPVKTYGDPCFSSTTPVYMPYYDADYPDASGWAARYSHSYTALGWVRTYANVAENASINIPYMDGTYAFNIADSGRKNTFAMDAEQNTDEMYESFRGDICQYLGKTDASLDGYRLPMSIEFGSSTGTHLNQDGWTLGGGFADHSSTLEMDQGYDYEFGTLDVTTFGGYAINSVMGYGGIPVIFPAAGGREHGSYYYGDNGYVGGTGNSGFYWAGSVASDQQAYVILVASVTVQTQSVNRNCGFPIRCIKK
jgi:hypothetical protein